MSGHSKWSTIKHRKGAKDAKRGKVFTKLIKEVTVAARESGGDPSGNPRLRRAIDTARAHNMPMDNITRAIQKGTGELEGVSYEELVYEGVGPAGTLFLCEVLTDNRNRTAAEVRKIFDKNEGQLGSSGSALWAFENKGVIKIAGAATTEEKLFEAAVGVGAEELEKIGDEWVVTTVREELDTVREAIRAAKIKIKEARLSYLPTNLKIVDNPDAQKLVALFDALDDHDDVQQVYSDFELSDAALEEMDS